ncbi:hypothetical protein GCM10017667_63000 [Streptomyces filamentosus]|uniref:EfeO-type cupredoxin-like domain-containing protein n=1 Tax=Streptomyces filamentosus TaxID=67294 RepID=A0A919ERN5_STRFL|nr:hypothetical protein GCM10017667_63000 [Streptomyces filamentosus]
MTRPSLRPVPRPPSPAGPRALFGAAPPGARGPAPRPARGSAPGPVPRRARRRRTAPLAAAALAAVLLLAAGCGGRATTHHKPGTGHEQATGNGGTLLAARDESGHRLRELPAADAPSVRAEARPDTEGGWNVHLTVERFRFTPESTGGGALAGRGHARLLVDGREAARAYGPWFHVPSGARTLTVRLYADDHTVWATAGAPVQTTLTLTPSAQSPSARTPSAGASSAPTPSPPPAPTPTGRTLDIRVTGSTVTPAPSRVELRKGERITLRVTADRADTVHVHGYDREAALAPGTPATLTLTADRTGLFEVETHESGLVLTQLVVR